MKYIFVVYLVGYINVNSIHCVSSVDGGSIYIVRIILAKSSSFSISKSFLNKKKSKPFLEGGTDFFIQFINSPTYRTGRSV
jgi:hypothetical protein